MGRPRRHIDMVKASRDEAILAVRLYNDPTERRSFAAFVVHMHLAWLNLLQAELTRDNVDFRYWKPGTPRRLDRGADGEARQWELSKCVARRWPDHQDPVRANLDLMIALRNKIEHRFVRFQRELTAAFGGHAQACLLNYERFLTDQFGQEQSLAHLLRFPVFVGSFTTEGERTLRQLRKRLPASLRTLQAQHELKLTPEVETDERYELRLRVVAELAPRDPEALAIQFTRYDDLSEEAKAALAVEGRTGFVAVREQQRAVVGLDLMRVKEVIVKVAAAIPFRFTSHDHTAAWHITGVRPPTKDPHPERTMEQYCVYDARHQDYGYTEAWVNRLIKKCSTREGFLELTGHDPARSAPKGQEQTVLDLTALAAPHGGSSADATPASESNSGTHPHQDHQRV